VKQLKDSLMRALAETENVRARGQRQTADAKKFAVQGFAKELLDIADNLTRASAAVPEDAATNEPAKHLEAFKQGVLAVEQILHQVFKKNALVRYESLGEVFDPNMHMALFKMPDPSRPNDVVGAVMKEGYTLHGRVIRSAEVGVVANA
jgi:molecular chaperone GrpE